MRFNEASGSHNHLENYDPVQDGSIDQLHELVLKEFYIKGNAAKGEPELFIINGDIELLKRAQDQVDFRQSSFLTAEDRVRLDELSVKINKIKQRLEAETESRGAA